MHSHGRIDLDLMRHEFITQLHLNPRTVALLELREILALLVEQVDRDILGCAHAQRRHVTEGDAIVNLSKGNERRRLRGADGTVALTSRTRRVRGRHGGGTHSLPGYLQQAEA